MENTPTFSTSNTKILPPEPTTPSTTTSRNRSTPRQSRVPTVYVVPPEEDQTSAWCFFDAAQPSETSHSTLPDFNFLDTTLSLLRLTADGATLETSTSVESPLKTNILPGDVSSPEEMPDSSITPNGRNGAEDSMVVEVIKVKRNGQDDNQGPKRSKGFKRHAAKAIRSIRKVTSRSSSSSKQGSTEGTENDGAHAQPSSRAPTPSLPRRPSFVLPQFFHPTLKSRSSFKPDSASSPYRNSAHSSTAPSLNFMNAEHIHPEPENEQHRRSCSSPNPSTTTYSAKRRFSMLSLQKLFSSAPTDHEPDSSSSTSPRSIPSLSRDSSAPSVSSRSGPSSPTQDLPEDEEDDLGQLLPRVTSKDDYSPFVQDLSFEMRLDTLNFEGLSLSFNAENF